MYWTSVQARKAFGGSLRQFDHATSRGYFVPKRNKGPNGGTSNRWDRTEILVITLVGALRELGIPMQRIGKHTPAYRELLGKFRKEGEPITVVVNRKTAVPVLAGWLVAAKGFSSSLVCVNLGGRLEAVGWGK